MAPHGGEAAFARWRGQDSKWTFRDNVVAQNRAQSDSCPAAFPTPLPGDTRSRVTPSCAPWLVPGASGESWCPIARNSLRVRLPAVRGHHIALRIYCQEHQDGDATLSVNASPSATNSCHSTVRRWRSPGLSYGDCGATPDLRTPSSVPIHVRAIETLRPEFNGRLGHDSATG